MRQIPIPDPHPLSLSEIPDGEDTGSKLSRFEPKVRLNALGYYTGAEQLCYKRNAKS